MDYGGKQLGEVAAKLVELEFKDAVNDEDAVELGRLIHLSRSLHSSISKKLQRLTTTETEGCTECVAVPLSLKLQVRKLAAALEAEDADAGHRAYSVLRANQSARGRRLCDLLGKPCSELERDYLLRLLTRLEEEARMVVQYAEHVSQSYLFQLEAREETFDLQGGGTIFQARMSLFEKAPDTFRRVAQQFYTAEVPDFSKTMVSAVQGLTPQNVLKPLLQQVHPSKRDVVRAAYEQRWRAFVTAFNLYAYST
jgi:hypothetical protein